MLSKIALRFMVAGVNTRNWNRGNFKTHFCSDLTPKGQLLEGRCSDLRVSSILTVLMACSIQLGVREWGKVVETVNNDALTREDERWTSSASEDCVNGMESSMPGV